MLRHESLRQFDFTFGALNNKLITVWYMSKIVFLKYTIFTPLTFLYYCYITIYSYISTDEYECLDHYTSVFSSIHFAHWGILLSVPRAGSSKLEVWNYEQMAFYKWDTAYSNLIANFQYISYKTHYDSQWLLHISQDPTQHGNKLNLKVRTYLQIKWSTEMAGSTMKDLSMMWVESN